MNRRQKIIVSIIGIILVSLFLIALTYGYYVTKINGNSNSKSITATTDNLELVYGDDDGSIIGDGEVITPNTTFDPKTFSVENKGKSTVEYSVILDNVVITDLSTGKKSTDENSNVCFESNDFVYTLTCTSGCNGVSTETTLPLYNNGILVSNSIDEGEKQTYSITITYKDTNVDQSADMNKSLEARINIASYDSSLNAKTLATVIIDNAKNVSDEQKSLGYAEFRETPLSGVGTSISGKNYTTSITESDITMVKGTSYSSSYWTYADDYTLDPINGFTLTGVHTCKYSECYSNLAGKYLVSKFPSGNCFDVNSSRSITGLTTIYKVDTAGTGPANNVFLKEYSISTVDVDESIILTTQDDYGTSYYYRGSVENNYLTFANMCWRIVRIAGDGSIKLILEDQDETCSKTMNGNWDISQNIVYGYISENNRDKINYLNYTGGMADGLKSFQKNKLADYTNKLKSGDWCYDDTAYQDEAGTMSINDTPSYSSDFYYGTYTRLVNKKEPSIKCSGTDMIKFGDGTTDMYVGALTADEVVFAGGKAESGNNNYYLVNGYEKSWMTVSPYKFSGSCDQMLWVNYLGFASNGCVSSSYDLRPSIILKAETTISDGDGTKENPYIVE